MAKKATKRAVGRALSAKGGAKPAERDGAAAAKLIDQRIRELGDWRGEVLQHVRRIIRGADRGIVEGWKWGVPVWLCGGVICTGETYKSVVKLTFAKGASLEDPARLFNSSLEGRVRRAIDIREGERVDADALRALVRAAVKLNHGEAGGGRGSPRLLAGGNPQIPKGEGEGPVRAYIAAMPGWKRAVGRRLDAIITRAVRSSAGGALREAVKWNSPLYGVEGRGWFLSVHCFDRYVKVAFFRGASLWPVPPGASKQKEVRYLDIYEGWKDKNGAPIDEAQVADWVRQASVMEGERM